jgi:hypothetical protein
VAATQVLSALNAEGGGSSFEREEAVTGWDIMDTDIRDTTSDASSVFKPKGRKRTPKPSRGSAGTVSLSAPAQGGKETKKKVRKRVREQDYNTMSTSHQEQHQMNITNDSRHTMESTFLPQPHPPALHHYSRCPMDLSGEQSRGGHPLQFLTTIPTGGMSKTRAKLKQKLLNETCNRKTEEQWELEM